MHLSRLAVLLAMAAVFSSSGVSAAQSTAPDAVVLAAVNAVLNAEKSGNVKLLRKLYMPNVTLVDSLPPYTWSGENAAAAYDADFERFAKKVKMTDIGVSFGTPRRIYVSTMTAYVVVPGIGTSKMDGKPFTEKGTLVFTLRKTNSGWKIATQSYAVDRQTVLSHDPYKM